jgi:hypothetical protein
MLKLGTARAPQQLTVATFAQSENRVAKRALWWTPLGFRIASIDDAELKAQQAAKRAQPVGRGYSPNEAAGKVVIAGAGIDAGKMLVYAEIMKGHERATDARLLASVLSDLGCSDVVLFEQSLSPAIGGARTLDGRPVAVSDDPAVHFVRGTAPGARRFLNDTPIVHPDVWAPLQRKRVRYFRKHEPNSGQESPEAAGKATNAGAGLKPAE